MRFDFPTDEMAQSNFADLATLVSEGELTNHPLHVAACITTLAAWVLGKRVMPVVGAASSDTVTCGDVTRRAVADLEATLATLDDSSNAETEAEDPEGSDREEFAGEVAAEGGVGLIVLKAVLTRVVARLPDGPLKTALLLVLEML